MREKVLLCRSGVGEVTDAVMTVITRSGIWGGVCIVTALDDKAAMVMTSREKADIRQDVMEDLDRMVPARVNRRGWVAGEVNDGAAEVIEATLSATARTKATMTGGSLNVIIHEGTLLLALDQGTFAVDYRGGEEAEPTILCS